MVIGSGFFTCLNGDIRFVLQLICSNQYPRDRVQSSERLHIQERSLYVVSLSLYMSRGPARHQFLYMVTMADDDHLIVRGYLAGLVG